MLKRSVVLSETAVAQKLNIIVCSMVKQTHEWVNLYMFYICVLLSLLHVWIEWRDSCSHQCPRCLRTDLDLVLAFSPRHPTHCCDDGHWTPTRGTRGGDQGPFCVESFIGARFTEREVREGTNCAKWKSSTLSSAPQNMYPQLLRSVLRWWEWPFVYDKCCLGTHFIASCMS